MIQAILIFQFILQELETGEIEPEFKPLQLVHREKSFRKEDFLSLITNTDLFSIYYHHTTSVHEITGEFTNFYTGRLKKTPYKVISYFKQQVNGSQYLTISIFSPNDELTLFEGLIKTMVKRLEYLFETLEKAIDVQQLSIISKINKQLENELHFTIFQIERLSQLDKLQKVALIFNSEERLEILDALRERPRSKSEVRDLVENIKENPNIDFLIKPFLELNLIRRDWIKGKRDKKTGLNEQQGEYLFLIKDIMLVRVLNNDILNKLNENNHELYLLYSKKVAEYFSKYDPTSQPIEETKKLASILLKPDIYDYFILIRNNYYPLDKIPNIFSEFADVEMIIEELKHLNIIIEIKDKKNRSWIFLLCDLKPLIFFPEYLLTKIRDAFNSEEKKDKISYEIAKKAFELLEVAYPEKTEF